VSQVKEALPLSLEFRKKIKRERTKENRRLTIQGERAMPL
jgi:hypothetical protein